MAAILDLPKFGTRCLIRMLSVPNVPNVPIVPIVPNNRDERGALGARMTRKFVKRSKFFFSFFFLVKTMRNYESHIFLAFGTLQWILNARTKPPPPQKKFEKIRSDL